MCAIAEPGATTVEGPSGPLAVTVRGTPTPEGTVVLVHPINTAGVVWQYVAPLLDRPSVAVDLRGHGRSGTEGPFTVEEGYVGDVLAVLDGLGLDSVHLAGGSLGGPISLATAVLHPHRVRSVSTFGSTLGVGIPAEAIEEMAVELRAKGTRRYFEDLAPQVVGTAWRADRRVLDAMAAAVGTRSEDTVAAILRGAFSADIRHLVGAGVPAVPVLAAGGTEDPTCPPAMTEEIAAAAGSAPVFLDGVGHLPMLEVPDRVAELIRDNVATAGR